ncbi:MAG: right-handed parallel beta-helix repeat-containing protein [Ignavibacteria bacterium]|nr:right-handed parallel beta-helix repeat-containing protein [Ignavibacteria bacterium]
MIFINISGVLFKITFIVIFLLKYNFSHGQISDFNLNNSPRTFYVSNTGNDLNSGLSEDKAWRTLNRVSIYKFQKGDVIQFRGGDLFKGNLIFNNESGTDELPIRITSYGLGRAVLRSEEGSCLSILHNGGFIIENLEITGLYDPDRDFAKKYKTPYAGFQVFTYAKLKSNKILIRDCIIRNFKNSGISLGGEANPQYGYTSIKIENNTIYDCGDIGVSLWGLVYQDILVTGNKIYNIKGVNPHLHGFSGNGISLSHIYNARVERNLIFNNGKYGKRSGGGIVTGESRNIHVRYNEIYGTKSNDVDGDAIDFDNGSDSCIAEYNYTHNNDGAGILISGDNNGSGSDNNIVRYNISKNDGLKNNHSAIKIYSTIGADHNRIYNNTIIVTAIGKNSPTCFDIQGSTTNTFVENNIFITVNSAKFINIDVSKQVNLIFRSNSYFNHNGLFVIIWGRKAYRSFNEFTAATGQEIFNSIKRGIYGDPKLRNPFTLRDTVNNAFKIDTLSAYKLFPFSPLINSGITVQKNFLPAVTDFYGKKLTPENPPDIGAYEH